MLKKQLLTCSELRSWRHRKLAVRWHLGNFPRHYRYLRKLGLQGLLDELKVLSGSKVSRVVNIRISAALAGATPEAHQDGIHKEWNSSACYYQLS